jgi:glycerate-2-kinase
VIASGPTVPSDFTGTGALALIDQYGVMDRVPRAVIDALGRSLTKGPREVFARDTVRVVGDNEAAVEAFAESAAADGRTVRRCLDAAQGEARELARRFVELALESDGDVVLGGGEATVTVRGDGTGGRNTEFALAAALELERLGRTEWTVASLATDGQDALTGVAGAIGSVAALQRARAAGVDPDKTLDANDSLAVFRAGGGCVEPGPTGTNVNDIYVAVRSR